MNLVPAPVLRHGLEIGVAEPWLHLLHERHRSPETVAERRFPPNQASPGSAPLLRSRPWHCRSPAKRVPETRRTGAGGCRGPTSAVRHFPFYSSALNVDGTVVIGGRDRMVHGIDAETGEMRWTFMTRARVDSS